MFIFLTSNKPATDLTGKLEPNSRLDKATPILDNEILGPESIAVRGDDLYTGLIGGNVIRVSDGKSYFVAKFGSECGMYENENEFYY